MKEDCFACHKNECMILHRRVCSGCKFYKTQEQLREGQEQSAARIQGLDKFDQEYIRFKYTLCR